MDFGKDTAMAEAEEGSEPPRKKQGQTATTAEEDTAMAEADKAWLAACGNYG